MEGENIERKVLGAVVRGYDTLKASDFYYDFQKKYYNKHRDEYIQAIQVGNLPAYVDKRADTFTRMAKLYYPESKKYIK